MNVTVLGPVKGTRVTKFLVRRLFFNEKQGKGFHLWFEIWYDSRSNKWHHFGARKTGYSLCHERLYLPDRKCACIRACEEKLNDGRKKDRR